MPSSSDRWERIRSSTSSRVDWEAISARRYQRARTRARAASRAGSAARRLPQRLRSPLDDVLLHPALGERDRVRDRAPARAAVADDHEPAQPEQNRRRRRSPGRAASRSGASRPRISRPPSFETVPERIASRTAPTTAFAVPSISFSATLPVKPSVTTTSTSPRGRSKPSTLPDEVERRLGAAPRAARAPRPRRACPSPAPRRPTAGRRAAARRPAPPRMKAAPMKANCTRCSGAHLDVRADVQQQHGPPGHRHDHRERRPVDAAAAASRAAARRPARRRSSPARHERLRAAVGDRARRLDDRGVRPRAHRLRRLVAFVIASGASTTSMPREARAERCRDLRRGTEEDAAGARGGGLGARRRRPRRARGRRRGRLLRLWRRALEAACRSTTWRPP